jgi:hypothetical protein
MSTLQGTPNRRSTFRSLSSGCCIDVLLTASYTTAIDPQRVILNDILSKCGIGGDSGTKSPIKVNYDLTLKLKVRTAFVQSSWQILGVTISPTISNSASFDCPVTEADIQVGLLCLT